MELFKDRYQAGFLLARALLEEGFGDLPDVLVMGLARGGVPVAAEVARILQAPLYVLVVRKLGTPGQEELAIGAIASGGGRVLNQEILNSMGVRHTQLEQVEAEQRLELERREKLYRGDEPFPNLEGKTVIVVDDGLATGATMRAAIASIKQHQAARVVVAVPVAPPDTVAELERLVNPVVCLEQPKAFITVGAWYQQFPQTSDEEVLELLGQKPYDLPEKYPPRNRSAPRRT
jgi:putative phosphoribosyl transferase